MGLCLGATAWGLAAGFAIPTVVSAVTIGNFILMVGLEQLLPRDGRVNLLRDRQAWNDVGHGVLFTFLGRPLAVSASVFVLSLVAWVRPGEGGLWWPAGAWLPLQVALGLGVWSFGNYWMHRAFHGFDALWWFHAIHHDTPQMHVLKSGRQHVGEVMLNFLLLPVPLLLLGVPAEVLVWIGLWNVFDGNLAHANLDQRFPYWAHYVLPTVQVHYVHHASERTLQDSNFSGPTALWDVLFGTFRHPLRHAVAATGLREAYVPRSFAGQVAFPFRALWRAPRIEPAPRDSETAAA
jgi:sterol desaturase/sphingolipid hydroxylase (fatty acid hydroxylase superfamily)